MKLNESKLLILMTSIILGFLLSSQLTFGKFSPREVLSLQSYQQASSELKKLHDEISILDDQKRKLSINLSRKKADESLSNAIENLKEELNKYDFYVGLTDVKGPGIVISLSDNPDYGKIVDTRETSQNGLVQDSDILLVHDYDILRLIWELKNAGAEAISINDQRIISNTDIYCGGPIIYVNGLELVPPYVVKAIGDAEGLTYALQNDESYYRWLEDRGLVASMRKEDTIKIFGYDRYINYSYIKPVKE